MISHLIEIITCSRLIEMFVGLISILIFTCFNFCSAKYRKGKMISRLNDMLIVSISFLFIS